MVIKISALKKLVDFAPDGEYDHLVFTPEFDDDYPRHVRYRIDLDSEAIKKAKAKGLRYDPAYANPSPPRKPQD